MPIRCSFTLPISICIPSLSACFCYYALFFSFFDLLLRGRVGTDLRQHTTAVRTTRRPRGNMTTGFCMDSGVHIVLAILQLATAHVQGTIFREPDVFFSCLFFASLLASQLIPPVDISSTLKRSHVRGHIRLLLLVWHT